MFRKAGGKLNKFHKVHVPRNENLHRPHGPRARAGSKLESAFIWGWGQQPFSGFVSNPVQEWGVDDLNEPFDFAQDRPPWRGAESGEPDRRNPIFIQQSVGWGLSWGRMFGGGCPRRAQDERNAFGVASCHLAWARPETS